MWALRTTETHSSPGHEEASHISEVDHFPGGTDDLQRAKDLYFLNPFFCLSTNTP